MLSTKSRVCAAAPVTLASFTPADAPSVAGTMPSRSSSSASLEGPSVPSPAVGTLMTATDLSGLTSTVGSPLNRAGCLAVSSPSSSIAAVTEAAVTSLPSTTTSAETPSLGNASLTLLIVCTTAMSCGSDSSPASARCSPNAGIVSATSTPVATSAETSGRRSTRSTIRPQTFSLATRALTRPSSGTRPFSMRSPSFDSRAGRTVTEPSIAIATTTIVPVANEVKSAAPARYMPLIAVITVTPEISTARPEVAAAASSAASALRPAARSSRIRRM